MTPLRLAPRLHTCAQLVAVRGLDVTVFERPDRNAAVPATDIRFDHFARSKPAVEDVIAPATRTGSFAEVHSGISESLDARRCFS